MKNTDGLTAYNVPSNTKLLDTILSGCVPRKLDRNSTQFDIGYEAAKRDLVMRLVPIIGKELAKSGVENYLESIKHG